MWLPCEYLWQRLQPIYIGPQLPVLLTDQSVSTLTTRQMLEASWGEPEVKVVA